MNVSLESYDLKIAQSMLPWLRDNSCELAWALEEPTSSDTQLPLVAIWQRIYFTKPWMVEKLSRIVWYFQEPQQQASLLNENVIRTIQEISKCIPSFLQHYEEHYARPYSHWIHKKIPLKEKELQEASQLLKKCSSAFWGLGVLFTEEKYEPAVKKIQHLLPSDQSFHLLCRRLRRAQCFVNLRGELEREIPFSIFVKLCRQEELSSAERHDLKDWMEALEERKSQIKQKDLDEAFVELVRVMNLENEEPITFDNFLLKLSEFPLFTETDHNHVQMRNGLLKEKTILFNGSVLNLEKQLSPVKLSEDHYRIFSLADPAHQHHVLKIGKNCHELKIEKVKIEKEQDFIQKIQNTNATARALATGEWHLKIIDIDQEGKGVLLERMESVLYQYQWKSQQLPLDPKEQKIIHTLACRLNLMMQKWVNQIPKNLNLKNLMVDAEGHVKFIGLIEMESFNYNTLEQFCLSIENSFIRKCLTRGSGLTQHPTAQFYQKAVEYTLMNGQTNELKQLQAVDFEQSIYEVHLQKLNEQALILRRTCFAKIETLLQEQQKYNHERQSTKLMKAVCEELVRLYRESCTPGTLQLYLEQEVLNNCETIYNRMISSSFS